MLSTEVAEIAPLALAVEDKELRRAGDKWMEAVEEEVSVEVDKAVLESKWPSSPTSCEIPAYSISWDMAAVDRLATEVGRLEVGRLDERFRASGTVVLVVGVVPELG